MPERLNLAVSSISCIEPGISLFSTDRSTGCMIDRAVKFQDALSAVFGKENISLSLHLARVIDTRKAVHRAQECGMNISSVDIPDIITIGSELRGFIHDSRLAVSEKGLTGSLKQEIPRTLSRAGWFMTNVGSKKDADAKLEEGMDALEKNSIPHIVRANMSYWVDSTRGDELRKALKKYPDAILALEMDPRGQTPHEYLELLDKLSATNNTETPVYADLDVGKFGQTKHQFHPNQQIPEPLEVYKKILMEKPGLVAITTLDQFVAGDVETHRHFSDGPIDLLEVAQLYGKASKNGLLPFAPMILTEFHPGMYQAIISPTGINVFRKIKASFDAT